VFLKESTPLLAALVERVRQSVLPAALREFDFLDDTCVDKSLQMLVDLRLTPSRIDEVQFLQRRQSRRMLEDVLGERKPRLLGDDGESLSSAHESVPSTTDELSNSVVRVSSKNRIA